MIQLRIFGTIFKPPEGLCCAIDMTSDINPPGDSGQVNKMVPIGLDSLIDGRVSYECRARIRSTHRGQIASSTGKGIPAESEQLIMVLL
jgi:hypothetical protein